MGMGARLIDQDDEANWDSFQADVYITVQKARAGQATEADWDFIESLLGARPSVARAPVIDTNEALPF
jgi:predicted RNA polymerase sigma factor